MTIGAEFWIPVTPWSMRGVIWLRGDIADWPDHGEVWTELEFGVTGIRRRYEGEWRRRGRWMWCRVRRYRKRRRWSLSLRHLGETGGP